MLLHCIQKEVLRPWTKAPEIASDVYNIQRDAAAEWSSQHVKSKDSDTDCESDADDETDVSKMTWG